MTFLQPCCGIVIGYPSALPLTLVVYGTAVLGLVAVVLVAWRVGRG